MTTGSNETPTDTDAVQARLSTALTIVDDAAALALRMFGERDALTIESKGLQDWVSDADRGVEDRIRAALRQACPDDGIVGEERATVAGESGYTWVIDPIDGTTLYVNGAPGWCVVLACVHRGRTVLGVIADPIARETYHAMRGAGTFLNGKPVDAASVQRLDQGSVSVGHSARDPIEPTLAVLRALLEAGGLYQRTGSGANCLAMVAAGRLIGYVEFHMNAWDCLAAMLLIEEAGGRVEGFDMQTMLASGGRVIAAAPGVYEALHAIAADAFDGNGV